MRADFHKKIVIGVEIEAYSIELDGHAISRRLSQPRPGLSERGERFTRDTSIGSEYNSRPFSTVRESLFLLKGGLRKYLRHFYRSRHSRRGQRVPLLVAVGANSPVWDRHLTEHASCRMLHLGDTYFPPRRTAAAGGELPSMVDHHRAPLIGITCEAEGPRGDFSAYDLVCNHRYPEAVKNAGGHPVLLPIAHRRPLMRRYLEGIEHPDRPHLLAVQWHPEQWPGSVYTRRLFSAFERQCRIYRDQSARPASW